MSQLKSNLLLSGDGDQIPIANTFVCHDASSTVKTSPLTISDANAFTMVPPLGAVAFAIKCSTPIQVSMLASVAEHILLAAAEWKALPCQANIYGKVPSGAGVIQFAFEIA